MATHEGRTPLRLVACSTNSPSSCLIGPGGRMRSSSCSRCSTHSFVVNEFPRPGVVASSGDLSVPLVVAAPRPAFAGDNTAYVIGRRFGRRIEARFSRARRGQTELVGPRRAARRAGPADRDWSFHPRRTDCGDAERGDAGASVAPLCVVRRDAHSAWALYATLLGSLGGRAFEDAPWKGLLLALAIALRPAGGVELTRWLLKRRPAHRAGRRGTSRRSRGN